MPAAGVIHEEAGNSGRPVLQHADEAVLGNMLRDLFFIGEPEAGLDDRLEPTFGPIHNQAR